MATATTLAESQPLILHFGPLLQKLTDREFFAFCQLNRDLRIERTSEGDLVIMPPTGGDMARISFTLTALFGIWVQEDGTGIGFDSSTGFTLPSGAKRSPDLAWVKRARWEALTQDEQQEFPPLCPDFVVELRSRSDYLDDLQAKMQEYVANGAQLGWLIDPIEKKVYVYRPEAQPTCLDNPKMLPGDPVLRGFQLDFERLWV
jgi:Uma2 family endonuclease